MEKQKRKKFRLNVKMLILMIATVPLLVACIVLVLLSNNVMTEGLDTQVLDGLKGIAIATSYSYDEVDLGEYHLKGDKLYKGNYNITDNITVLDKIAQSNDAVLTVFYGDTRRATTIINDAGQRIVGTMAGTEVISAVLNNGQEYSSTDVVINNADYYGYYVPIRNNSGGVVGMMFAGKPRAEVRDYITSRSNFIMSFAVAIYVLCLFSTIMLTQKKVLTPISKISGIALRMAEGDINQDIKRESDDEFGDLMEDFAHMVKNIGDQARIAEKFADGDLTITCKPASERDVLGLALKKMLRDNNQNLSIIRDAAARMATGADEVASASNSLAQGTTEQASAIEEITASIEEIANGAKVNAEDANAANELVQNTKEGAIRGNEQMKNMITAMKDINESSENISKIMKVIDDIAFQTNILALNASVEAARAGVHGKGFAVVADEVRNLASKSADAAKSSAEMIEDSIKKVGIGSKLAEETAVALEEIESSVGDIARLVERIATASANQAKSVGQVNSGITQIADVVQTNSATSEQCAAASAELSSLAGQLQHAVAKYKLLSGRVYRTEFDEDNGMNGEEDRYRDNESIISLDGDFGKY